MKAYKTHVLSLLSVFIISFCNANENDITLEKIWKDRLFAPKTIKLGKSMQDGLRYSQVDNYTDLNIYDYQTGELLEFFFSSVNIPHDSGTKPVIDNYIFSPDETKIIIAVEQEQIYRRSRKAVHYIYDIQNESLRLLDSSGKQRIPTFSPNGNKIAYVRNNNIYIYDIKTEQISSITSDGEFNHIINGTTDWVYEEEFYLTQGLYWSPGSDKLAYYRFDESSVKEFNMIIYGELYPEEYRFKYPKAGEKNALVTIHIYNINDANVININLGDPEDQYIPRIKWTKGNSKLSIQRLNRHQNHLEILIADAKSGETKVIYDEKNEYYIDITDDLYFLNDKEHFIISSEREGYNRLYLYNINGALIKALTPNKKEVKEFLGYNEDNKSLYFVAFDNHPAFTHLYSINIDEMSIKSLTDKDGLNNPTFSNKFKFFINVFSTANTPPVFAIHKADGSLIKVLEDNKELVDIVQDYGFVEKEFFTINTENNIELFAYIIKPPDFDPEKKYPLFMYVYGGPGSQTVTNRWDSFNGAWYQMLARQGYVVVSVDNRGAGGRGEEFKKMTYLNLGKYETIDQINSAKYLGSLDYIDENRIGIFGWSYGGYISSLCLALGADVFSAAIAVAPVTHWKFYDTIYTERYMRTPYENTDGYELNSPINFVEKIKGNYLLVHGSADDNVHYQNTMEMIDALVEANIIFDLMIYPNQNHSIYRGNARLHLYRIMTNFILDKL